VSLERGSTAVWWLKYVMLNPQDEDEGNNECCCHDKEAEAWGDVASGRVEGIVDHRCQEGT